MGETATKRIGRPEGRKPLLNLRIEQELLDQLRTAAAEHAQRTIAEETVDRLRRSFGDHQMHAQALQREVDMRMRAEDDLHAARDRIEELELMIQNFKTDVHDAVLDAFKRVGFQPKDGDR